MGFPDSGTVFALGRAGGFAAGVTTSRVRLTDFDVATGCVFSDNELFKIKRCIPNDTNQKGRV
jgi:hypothetical protein